jgi:hypothetical protein
MRRARPLSAALVALLLAVLAASQALGRGSPVVAVGGFSSQVSPDSARAEATVSVPTPAAGGSGASAAGAGSGAPAPPPPPTLASDSPLLANPAPAGPGSLWYQGAFGERCVYAPDASPLCYAIVAPAQPSLDVPATAASLAGQLSLSLAPIEASPSAADRGLTGATSWFWLEAPPAAKELSLSLDGETVTVSARPGPVAWSFGDGTSLEGGAGIPFEPGAVPAAAVTHVFGTRCLPGDRGADPYVLPACGRGGYTVSAAVGWTIGYRASGWLSESAALPGRSSESELTYPVSEVRSFLGQGAG